MDLAIIAINEKKNIKKVLSKTKIFSAKFFIIWKM